MTQLFHSAPIMLREGSVIEPGNFGRLLSAVGASHPLYIREMELERVRSLRYPEKPSRLMACFACPTEEVLRAYVSSMAQKGSRTLLPVLYEVEKVDRKAAEHKSDYNVVQPIPGLSCTMEQIADLYWQSAFRVTVVERPHIPNDEIVTLSALRIIRRLG